MFWAVLSRDAVWDSDTAGLHQMMLGLAWLVLTLSKPQQCQLNTVLPALPVLHPAAMPHSMPHSSTWAGTSQGWLLLKSELISSGASIKISRWFTVLSQLMQHFKMGDKGSAGVGSERLPGPSRHKKCLQPMEPQNFSCGYDKMPLSFYLSC